MKTKYIVSLLLLSVFALPSLKAAVPDTVVMSSTYNTINVDCGQSYVVYDNGGPSGRYYGSGARYVTIHTSGTGTPIRFSVRGIVASDDYVTIYNATSPAPSVLDANSRIWVSNGQLIWNGVSRTGEATIKFNIPYVTTANSYDGFEIRVWVTDSTEISDVHNSNITSTSAHISWVDTSDADLWTVHYGTNERNLDLSATTTTPSIDLTGLTPNRPYYLRVFNNRMTNDTLAGYCMPNGSFFLTLGDEATPEGCVGDFADLAADNVICTYGHYNNPAENFGIATNRHTVKDDSTAFDSRIGDSLRVMPYGATRSIRLGNDNYNNEAESIIYRFKVDTSVNDMLLFKYAAVLQNPPTHSDEVQPRLDFEILRADGSTIDVACYSAEFVATNTLGLLPGWHNHGRPQGSDGRLLWHDWTSVGLDLTSLDGETLYIKITTKDCNENATNNTGRHFGYAYFTLECANKNMQYDGCGLSSVASFTAPDGFHYFWHEQGQTDTLSTERTFNPPAGSTSIYECTMTFSGSTNNSCSFSLTANPSLAMSYPQAAFSAPDTVSCGDEAAFFNQSFVSSDAEGLSPVSERQCSHYYWDFGDGTTSELANPSHLFPSRTTDADYAVTLSSFLSDSCISSITHQITVRACSLDPSLFPDNVNVEPCSFPIEPTEWDIVLDTSLGFAASTTQGAVCNLITPLIGDLDDDGIPEIVCFGTKGGDGSGNPTSQLKRLLVFDGSTYELKSFFDIGSGSSSSCFVSGFDAAPYGLVKLADRTGLIVVACKDNYLRAFTIDGSLVWTSDAPFGTTVSSPANKPYATNVAFADFNNDSVPEVYVRGYIFNAATGTLLVHASSPNNNEGSAYCHTYNATGNSAWKLGSSFASNIIDDDNLELLLGNELYTISITNTNGTAGNSATLAATAPAITTASVPTDGHAEVADFNLDGFLDVFVSTRQNGNHSSTVYGYVWDVHNNTVSTPFAIPTTKTGKSMPLICDLDNDDSLEVVIHCGVPGANVKAFKYHASTRTFTPFWNKGYNEDSFSNGVTLFDFNQDGVSELLISDQATISIANGSVENVSPTDISSLNFSEVTIMQYPLIADINNDGAAEIVFVGSAKLNICRSNGDPWAPARPVWNQYMYDITNVNKDLTIPSHLFNNAQYFVDNRGEQSVVRRPYNNFLQQATNIDTNGLPYHTAPDLFPSSASIVQSQDTVNLHFEICNQGESALLADTLFVTLYKNLYHGDVIESLENVNLNGLFVVNPQQCAVVDVDFPVNVFCPFLPMDSLTLALNDRRGAGVGQGGVPQECDTTNNVFSLPINIVSSRDSIYDTVCQSMPYTLHGFDITSDQTAMSGLVTDSITLAEGCGNKRLLFLVVEPAPQSDTTAVACDSFEWYGMTYTDSLDVTGARPTHRFSTLFGCDSVVTLHLTVNNTVYINDTITFCGDTVYRGYSFSHPGDTMVVISHDGECDSVIALHLNVRADLVPVVAGASLTMQGEGANLLMYVKNIGNTAFVCDTMRTSIYTNAYGVDFMATISSYNESGDDVVIAPDSSRKVNILIPLSYLCPHTPIDTLVFAVNDSFGHGVGVDVPAECDYTNNILKLPLHLTRNDTVFYDTICQGTPYTLHGFNIPASRTATPGLILDTLVATSYCSDTTFLHLVVNASSTSDTAAVACDNFEWYGTAYTLSGDYTHQFQSLAGCDSTVTLHLTVNNSIHTSETLSFCGDTTYRGFHFVHAGDTSVVVSHEGMCDSIIALRLSTRSDLAPMSSGASVSLEEGGAHIVFDIKNIGGTAFMCDSLHTSVYANTYRANYVVTISSVNEAGGRLILVPDTICKVDIVIPYSYLCPLSPIDTLVFAVNDLYGHGVGVGQPAECDYSNNILKFAMHLETNNTTITDNVCQGSAYSRHGFDIPASRTAVAGLIRDTLVSTVFCSDTTFLLLTVNAASAGDTAASVCDGFEWYGQSYSTSGDYTHRVATMAGCDSIVTLHLTIYPSYNDDETHIAMCDGESYTFGGVTYTTTGRYPHTFSTIHRCDSVVTLDLTVHPSYNIIDSVLFCSSDPDKGFVWTDGQIFFQSTNEPSMALVSSHGCDSTVHLNLTIDRSLRARVHYEPNRPTFDNPRVCFTDITGNDIACQWYLPDGTISYEHTTCFEALFDVDSLNVSLIVASSIGCFDTTQVTVKLDHTAIFIPNVFTPNLSSESDKNATFYIVTRQILEAEVSVFTREGLHITTFNGLTEWWDGTYKEQLCPTGTYVYHVRYRTAAEPDEWQVRVGTVTLLR